MSRSGSPEPGLAAAIDLGTNTFHLLVGQLSPTGKLVEVARERIFVKVAAEGIERIGDASFARAVAAAELIGSRLSAYPGVPTVAFGTAALRTASNGPELRVALERSLGVPIQIIDGEREAGLIARGVTAAALPPAPHYLIMDIGGGSVEFILVSDGVAAYRASFPVGAQVLRSRFHVREPFVGQDSAGTQDRHQPDALRMYLRATLAPMLTVCAGLGVQLLGSSGTFDVLADLYGEPVAEAVWRIESSTVEGLYAEASRLDLAQRFADARIPDDRADMLVVALALIGFVLEAFPQAYILACAYALKEGALLELLEGK